MEYTSWESVPLEIMSDMISRKIVAGDKAMVAQVFLKKDAVVPEHHHDSEQITYILEGALKFEIEGKEIVVRKGEVLSIPSNVPHRAVALEDTVDLDIFSPIRTDWLTRNDAYLRRGERATAAPQSGAASRNSSSPAVQSADRQYTPHYRSPSATRLPAECGP